MMNRIIALLMRFTDICKLFLLTIISARFLEVEQFGVVSFTVSIGSIIAVISDYRTTDFLIRELDPERDNKALTCSISMLLFVVNVFILIIATIYDYLFSHNFYITLFSVSLFFYSFRFFKNILFFTGDLKAIVYVEVISVLFFIVLVFLFYDGFTISSFYAIRIIDSTFVFLLFIIYIFKFKIFSFDRRSILYSLEIFWRYSYLVLAGVAVIFSQRLDYIFVKMFLGDFLLGQYAAYLNIITLASVSLIVIAQADIYKIKAEGLITDDGYQNYIKNNLKIGFCLSLIVCIFSTSIVEFLFGNKYVIDIFYFDLIIALTPVLISLGVTGSNVIVAKGLHQKLHLKVLISFLLSIAISPILIYQNGITGAVTAMVLNLFLANFLLNAFFSDFKQTFKMQCRAIKGVLN